MLCAKFYPQSSRGRLPPFQGHYPPLGRDSVPTLRLLPAWWSSASTRPASACLWPIHYLPCSLLLPSSEVILHSSSVDPTCKPPEHLLNYLSLTLLGRAGPQPTPLFFLSKRPSEGEGGWSFRMTGCHPQSGHPHTSCSSDPSLYSQISALLELML